MPACPKPIHEPKQKKSYSSLKQKTSIRSKFSKPSKEVHEWKKGILSHHKTTPSRKDRGDFPPKVVKELTEEAGGRCQCGCSLPDNETHHVMPRTRDGRGVKTNGMRVNSICNTRFHDNEEELQKWIVVYTKKYGEYFWYDNKDWEVHQRKKEQIKALEQRERVLAETFKPVTQLLTKGIVRDLSQAENQLIRKIGSNNEDLKTFMNLIKDISVISNKV